MKLHDAPGACSLAIHIALREIDATFDSATADVRQHRTPQDADRPRVRDALPAEGLEK